MRFVLVIILVPRPAAAQRTVFVEGLRELTGAMMTISDNRVQVNASIDKMAAALDAWDAAAASATDSLLGDETAAIPILPLAAYADGFARIRRGDYREALVSLRRAAAAAGDERSELVAAARLAQEGRYVEAERALRAIVTTRPESSVAHWWLGRVYENLNAIAEARKEYETVVPLALTGRASLYLTIGRLADIEGNVARATEAFEARLRITPNDPVAHKDLAWVLLEQDRTEAALAELEIVVATNPRDAEAHAAIGRLRLEAGLYGQAITALRRALELQPAMHEARYALAMVLKRSGREDEAAREMQLFERGRREATEDRRRTMAAEAQRQDEAQRDRGR
jgi:tetratricopeptide (TPR) repeat protein